MLSRPGLKLVLEQAGPITGKLENVAQAPYIHYTLQYIDPHNFTSHNHYIITNRPNRHI